MTGEFSSQWKSVKFMQDHNPANDPQGTDQHTMSDQEFESFSLMEGFLSSPLPQT
jgi:hypothetical protein